MTYGAFDNARREYVITRPDTPLPWINYLGVDEYCGLISNTAGGYSFYRDPRERRILRYRYNNVPADRPGRYIYIRDNASGDYWSGSWQPVLKDPESYQYECRHGLSYSVISSGYSGIRTETTYFVPLGENLEIWHLKVRNASRRKRSLGIFTYAEFCLWDAVNDMTDFQYNLNIGQTKFSGNTIYHLTNYHAHQPCYAWFWANRKVVSWDGLRQAFIGPYRSESNPIAVEKGGCSNTAASGWAPFAGHEHRAVPRRRRRGGHRLHPRLRGDMGGGRRPAPEVPQLRERRSRAREAARLVGRDPRTVFREDPGRGGELHGQRLEPVPVPHDVQLVAFRLVLRVGHRPGHGIPRLQPGHPRVRAPDPLPRAAEAAGHRGHPVPRGPGAPPVLAADEEGRRGRLRRRPPLADHRRLPLHEGDG